MKVANAPCSWGVLEFDVEGQAAGYAQVLDEIAQSGYAGTELGDFGFMPTDSAVLAEELKKRNLSMLAAFVPVDLSDASAHRAGTEAALKVARLLANVSNNPFIVLSDDNGKNDVRRKMAGRIGKEHQLSDAQWQTFTAGADQIARTVLESTGVKTVFHHHCAGFVETPDEVERFLAGTNPLYLGLCLDTGHYTFGGGDPVRAFDKFAARIWHVHFKDCQPHVVRARSILLSW
jgi:inosose dehydratase